MLYSNLTHCEQGPPEGMGLVSAATSRLYVGVCPPANTCEIYAWHPRYPYLDLASETDRKLET